MTRVISAAVVGAGWVSHARHAPAYAANPRARLAGICDPFAPDAAQAIASENGSSVIASLDDLLASDVDLVSVCTPPASHAEICERLLLAGKHVLVEKPVALTVDDASRLADLATERNLALCPCHNLLFVEAVLNAPKVLAGAGSVQSATAVQWNARGTRTAAWSREMPHGHFVEDAPHGLYLLQHFLGDLRVDDARKRTAPGEMEWFRVDLDAGGRAASLVVGTGVPIRTWAVMLVCENAIVVVDVQRNLTMRIPGDDANRRTGARAAGVAKQTAAWALERVRTRGRRPNSHQTLIARLVDSVADGTPPPLPAIDGVKSVALTQAAVSRLG